MDDISVSALFIRFFLGGLAVVASTIISKKLGERTGGIFAAFPAVYLAALLTAHLDMNGKALITHSIILSKGAMIGMGINILVAITAGYFLQKYGWKRAIAQAMICWLLVSMAIVAFTSY